MKKIIAIFCIFAFLVGEESQDLNPIDGTNASVPKIKQGKFLQIGIGPSLFPRNFRDNFFGFSASAGIMMYPQEDF